MCSPSYECICVRTTGTGAGYGDLEGYVEGESGWKESHDNTMKQQHSEELKSKKPPVLTTNSYHEATAPIVSPTSSSSPQPHHQHHAGPIEKLKHKVQSTIRKVKSRKHKGSSGGEEKDHHSGSSSSEDESGEQHRN
jgi:hypothetical protein